MRLHSFIARGVVLLVLMLMQVFGAAAEGLKPLPMDTYTGGPVPKDEAFLSDTEYEDNSITVKIIKGRNADTDYTYAYVKISDPSQLRTAPAAIVNSPKANFRSTSTGRGRYVARAVNAVISLNGDYFTKTDKCQVVMRQTQQVRNSANGAMDVLIIDRKGDFDSLQSCTKEMYNQYYEAHKQDMYQAFCFGPVMVLDGKSVISQDYSNGNVGAQNSTQRSAIAQLGTLEYLLVTTEGPQSNGSKGMTIPEFAALCAELGYQFSETGCSLAFNLDGGNSATMNFKQADSKSGKLLYAKVNSPDIERFLSDIIYFATLVE
jgi:exopolysaccharide biosynthesis protein